MSARAEAAPRKPAPARPVRIVFKHHGLVRVTPWLNGPLLLGLIVSGLAIYWAAPVFEHAPDPRTANTDYLADLGIWIVRHVPGAGPTPRPEAWIYDHFSIGPGELARALRL